MKTDWLWLGPILLLASPAIIPGWIIGTLIGKLRRWLDDRAGFRNADPHNFV